MSNNLLIDLATIPDYVEKGGIQLLITIVGAILVGWLSSTLFARWKETNVVKGVLIKRRYTIYEELSAKLIKLQDSVMLPNSTFQAAKEGLEAAELSVTNPLNRQLLKIFENPKDLTSSILDLDKYISKHRLYFDDDVTLETLIFQNYLVIFRRILVVFEEQFIDKKISLETECVSAAEKLMCVQIGLVVQDELLDRIDKVMKSLRKSMNNPSLKFRQSIEMSYSYYNDENAPIMNALKDTILIKDKGQICKIVTSAIYNGMTDCGIYE